MDPIEKPQSFSAYWGNSQCGDIRLTTTVRRCQGAYKEIIRKAREENDFTSLRLLILMADEGVDDFTGLLLDVLLTELRTELDAQFLALGFKSGENERSV